MSTDIVRGAPMRMTLVALAFAACYAVAQLAGLRDSVSVLATGATNDVLPGLLYAASYFAAVLLAPPLLLAAGMIAAGRALSKRATDEPT